MQSCAWSSPFPHSAPQPVLRVDRRACHHLYFIGWSSKLYIKLLQQHGQRYRRLQERELVSHTFAGSSTKGKESKICYNLIRAVRYSLNFLEKEVYSVVERMKILLFKQTSLGYIAPGLRSGSKPAHPSMLSSFFGTENLSGSNSFGRSQKYGDLWRLYICSASIYHMTRTESNL